MTFEIRDPLEVEDKVDPQDMRVLQEVDVIMCTLQADTPRFGKTLVCFWNYYKIVYTWTDKTFQFSGRKLLEQLLDNELVINVWFKPYVVAVHIWNKRHWVREQQKIGQNSLNALPVPSHTASPATRLLMPNTVHKRTRAAFEGEGDGEGVGEEEGERVRQGTVSGRRFNLAPVKRPRLRRHPSHLPTTQTMIPSIAVLPPGTH